MVMMSYGVVIEFTHSAKTPVIPDESGYSGYWHLIGQEINNKWRFVLHGFEPDEINWNQNHDKNWSEALTEAENEHLLELLKLMKPGTPQNMLQGFDGTTITLEISEPGQEKRSFSWWMKAPEEWKSVEAVFVYVSKIAKDSYSRFLTRQA